MNSRPPLRWLPRVAIVGSVALLVSGCYSNALPRESDIIGTWSSVEAGSWAEPGGSITFADDGTFVANDVPEAMLSGSDETTPIDGSGTWEIDDGSFGSKSNYLDAGVLLTYETDPVGSNGFKLSFETSGNSTRLRYWHNIDTGERYLLVRN